MINKILKAYKNPTLVLLYILNKKIFSLVSDKIYLKIIYRLKTRKKLNLNNPETFNEKLQWLKLYDRNPEYTKLVDKYEVRKYIANTIGEKYLIPLIGVWDKFEDIDFSTLPNQFVLKCTHDSGGIVICKDKSTFDIDAARQKINKSLKRNYYYHGREWPYKNVKPRIICEKYMVDESGIELKDYKFFCFSGKPKIIQVDFNRYRGHKRNLYDKDWNYIPMSIKYPTNSDVKIKKPNKLKDMLMFATLLSKNCPHVRVDFYSMNDSIFFGELTLYPGSGCEEFTPESYDYILGSWLELPSKKL
ncbi:MAG: ATP-grasp fold amidoligase family protein [bacterium]